MRVACIYIDPPAPLDDFAEACLKFSPQICLRKDEAVFIEIGRCKTLYNENTFLTEAKKLVQAFSFEARIAIRDGIVLAQIAARYGTDDLAKLPISALPLFSDPFHFSKEEGSIDKLEDALKKVGIKNLKEFSELSEAQISTRFGKLGLFWRRQVIDPSNTPWPKWSPRELICETLSLSYDDACGSIEPLLFKSKVILDRIFERIKKRGLRLVKLRVNLKLEKYSTIKRPEREWTFEFAFPQESTQAVLPILRDRWDKEFQKTPLESLVLEVCFEVKEMISGFEGQANYIDQSNEVNANHQALLSLLSEKNGKDKVYKASLKKRRLPEYAWEKTKAHEAKALKLFATLPDRPTKVISKPLPLRITHQKIFLEKLDRSYTVVSWSEVEKLRDQWEDGVIERDYYKVTILEGPPLWVFKIPEGEYFLNGWFE